MSYHYESWPLEPGKIYELTVEIWPTCIILPKSFSLGLQISGHDFEREPPNDPNEAWVRGSGPWLHNHPADRPESIFGGKTTIYTGSSTLSHLTLPVIGSQ